MFPIPSDSVRKQRTSRRRNVRNADVGFQIHVEGRETGWIASLFAPFLLSRISDPSHDLNRHHCPDNTRNEKSRCLWLLRSYAKSKQLFSLQVTVLPGFCDLKEPLLRLLLLNNVFIIFRYVVTENFENDTSTDSERRITVYQSWLSLIKTSKINLNIMSSHLNLIHGNASNNQVSDDEFVDIIY